MFILIRSTWILGVALASTFATTNASAQFLPAELYDVGLEAGSLAVGDMDDDGFPDLVVGKGGSPQHIRILTNSGNGTFQSFTTLGSTQFSPRDIGLADVDGNGYRDIVWSDASDLGIYVLLGSGTTIFAPVAIYPAGSSVRAIGIADFTGDGVLDVLASTNDAALFVGNGDGTFGPGWLHIPLEEPPAEFAVADFNNDGKLDFASFYTSSNAKAVVSFGAGGGVFLPEVTYPVGSNPTGIVTGDANGDGFLDLLVAAAVPPQVSVLFGNGLGSFSQGPVLLASSAPRAPRMGDFNSDGLQDIGIATSASGIVVFLGAGGGSFAPVSSFPTGGAAPSELEAEDLDSNGVPDIVTTNGSSISVLLASANACGSSVASAAVVRLGMPPNPHALVSDDAEGSVVGEMWSCYVDHSSFLPNALVDTLLMSFSPLNLPAGPRGTLLCNLVPPSVSTSVPAGQAFTFVIPLDCSLVGLGLCIQAASTSTSGTKLTNALDVQLGAF